MKKFLSILLCVLWMGLIYYNSSQDGTASNDFTYKAVDKIITIVDKIDGSESSNIKVFSSPNSLKGSFTNDRVVVNKILRKVAHVTEFLILAILLSNAFFTCEVKGRKAIVYILFIILFYAVLDEFHQIYVAGRGSSVKDVLIDFAGGIIGMIVYYIYYYFLKMNRIKKKAR